MRYLVSGAGPPLVLLHGLLGYSFSWRLVISRLASRFTVYAPDMPGSGFSSRPEPLDACLHSSAQRMLGFMDALGIESCVLVGTSRGGEVAMMAASLAPKRINKLVLVAPVNPWSNFGRKRVALLSSRIISPAFLAFAPRLRFTYGYVLRRLYADPRKIPPGTLEGYAAPLKIRGTFENLLVVLRTWKSDLCELESVLPAIAHIPTLLVWGRLDRAVDPNSAMELKKHFHDAQLVILEDVGHLPYEESPEQFTDAVLRFLEGG